MGLHSKFHSVHRAVSELITNTTIIYSVDFLPNDDFYRRQTQPMCFTGMTRVCVKNFTPYIAPFWNLSQTQLSVIQYI